MLSELLVRTLHFRLVAHARVTPDFSGSGTTAAGAPPKYSMARSGLRCAHPLFVAMSQPEGVLRVSAYVYNSIQDTNTLCESLGELLTAFGA